MLHIIAFNVCWIVAAGITPAMARVSYQFTIVSNAADEQLSAALSELSAQGWDVIGFACRPKGCVALLKREKDFEVAPSLQEVFEANEPTDAVSRTEIPLEEMKARQQSR
jgi:hypothetical protein